MRPKRTRPGAAVLVAALAATIVKFFLIDLAIVDGRSMLPSWEGGDIVVVLRCAYGLRLPPGLGGLSRYVLRWGGPRPGEVVAASSPSDGHAVVKRVAAVGPAELRIEGGRLTGAGLDLDLDPAEAAILDARIRLPPRSVFLLGDNLPESVDSRSYGPVADDMIAGKVLGGPLFRPVDPQGRPEPVAGSGDASWPSRASLALREIMYREPIHE